MWPDKNGFVIASEKDNKVPDDLEDHVWTVRSAFRFLQNDIIWESPITFNFPYVTYNNIVYNPIYHENAHYAHFYQLTYKKNGNTYTSAPSRKNFLVGVVFRADATIESLTFDIAIRESRNYNSPNLILRYEGNTDTPRLRIGATTQIPGRWNTRSPPAPVVSPGDDVEFSVVASPQESKDYSLVYATMALLLVVVLVRLKVLKI